MEFTVVQGDIATERADALVNAAGTSLRMGSGVAGALRRGANGPIDEAATSEGPVDLGEVAVTDAYDLAAEHVVGNRFADIRSGAMPRLNQVGNKLINWAYRAIHRRDHHDILSGYRAMTLDSLDRMNLSAEGFGIETEMCVECVRHGIDSMEVPITYETRPDGSETNLHPIKDGVRSSSRSIAWRKRTTCCSTSEASACSRCSAAC